MGAAEEGVVGEREDGRREEMFETCRKIEDLGERTQKETGEILDAIVEAGMSFSEAVYILEQAIKELKEGEMELMKKNTGHKNHPLVHKDYRTER